MKYVLDLHTHSSASPDGGLRLEDYARMLQTGPLTHIAITDHNRIDFAVTAHERLGDGIIVGEEIKTTEGEIIGLFLREPVAAGLSAAETAARIHSQGGIVYIPHPFETIRSGVSPAVLDHIAGRVDIIETYNGRALLRQKNRRAEAWAQQHHCPGAASSDAHGRAGWGRTYSAIGNKPTARTLAQALQTASYRHTTVGLRGALYPSLNRLGKRLARA